MIGKAFLQRLADAVGRAHLEASARQTPWDGDLQPSDGVNPDKGIICPWNKDEHGPCGRRIHCLVWKNWDDFNDWGSEYDFRFCRQLCQYGRNPEQANRGRQIRDRLVRTPAWLKQIGPPPVYRLPPKVRRGP